MYEPGGLMKQHAYRNLFAVVVFALVLLTAMTKDNVWAGTVPEQSLASLESRNGGRVCWKDAERVG